MGPHRTRLIKLLENGCEDADVLKEAILSCLQHNKENGAEPSSPTSGSSSPTNQQQQQLNGTQNDTLTTSAVNFSLTENNNNNNNDGTVEGAHAQEGLSSPLRDQRQHSSPVRCVDATVLGPLDFPISSAQKMTCLEIAVLTQNNTAVELLLQNGAAADVISGLSCTSLCKVCYTFLVTTHDEVATGGRSQPRRNHKQ